jgi:L-threonylcarbamoyladenylate synthase
MSDPTISDQELEAACLALGNGALIGLPTETVYGLAADATNARAVIAIYEAKGRPRFNPLISHVASLEAAMQQGAFSPLAQRLAMAFWPGPLTLVVPRQRDASVCDLACAGLDTIALRVPNHSVALALLRAYARPLCAPSANMSGRPSPTTAAHVREEMGEKAQLVLDGGPCVVGLESAVVAVSGNQATLLRQGGLSRGEIEAICGPLLVPGHADLAAPASPGMVLRHYAPKAPVVINQLSTPTSGIMIGFGEVQGDPAFNLSRAGDVGQAAANLFAYLRAADAKGPKVIAIAPIPDHGLGEAINDRLARAADGQKSRTS